MDAGTPSSGAIQDTFIEQQRHQSTKKHHI